MGCRFSAGSAGLRIFDGNEEIEFLSPSVVLFGDEELVESALTKVGKQRWKMLWRAVIDAGAASKNEPSWAVV